ncbi:stage II sporulation protein D [Garciella nitratireducens]|uniref:Stage II sporulation protein D n=1 Tax=Garciella nitratireducens DSM 15102 TaxID=1121911 RepID=A0A1T4MLK5_9FIRM|nr:stage II sporulation protein D [Garciella nitratireducens]RBP37814.1 stage II sporulation protein D [Garciella nitratireducens]SJZ67716.1 stage II sporulation protein D [Garciella nitratireducens DSM 15102]
MKLIGYTVVLILILIIILPLFMVNGCEVKNEPKQDLLSEEEVHISVLNHTNHEVMEINLEEYIVGVVAAEMPVVFDIEALKAQAIAARTYVVKRLEEFGGSPDKEHPQYDVCTDPSHCQAWITKEDRIKAWKNDKKYKKLDPEESWGKIQEAVMSTQGEIAVYDGQPIDPLFHSTSGGKTENSEDYFGNKVPYLRSVVSEYEQDSPNLVSEMVITTTEFIDKLKKKFPDIKVSIKNIENQIKVLETTEGGKIGKIQIGNKTMTGREAREILGLKSSNFEVKQKGNKVYFTVIGYGHGVGMSQYGADGMAKQGSNYQQILKHYYQGIEIINIYKK